MSCTCDLLTWKDPVKTGKVFGSIVFALVIFKKVNLFNVFFHLAYIGLLLSAAVEYAGKLVTGQGFVTKYKPSTKSYAQKFNDEVLPNIANAAIKVESEFQKIIYAHDIETTLKAAGISYVLYKVTSWFSFFTLLVISVVVLFTAPAIYSHNKKEIDAAIAEYSKLIKEKTGEITKLAQEKAAPHLEALIKKTGPVGDFIFSKIPVRTAGSTVGEEPVTSEPEPTATSTGASKFPEVPVKSSEGPTVYEFSDEAKSSADI